MTIENRGGNWLTQVYLKKSQLNGVYRVVSLEFKFPEIYSHFFRKFSENLRNDITGNFLPLQTFQITVHLLTTTLFKGFYSICRLS